MSPSSWSWQSEYGQQSDLSWLGGVMNGRPNAMLYLTSFVVLHILLHVPSVCSYHQHQISHTQWIEHTSILISEIYFLHSILDRHLSNIIIVYFIHIY